MLSRVCICALMCMFLVFIFASVTEGSLTNEPVPTEYYDRKRHLDTKGEYWLFWKYNSTHVTFETHVATLGYVGFGFSKTGGMFPADVIVGWVKDGVTHFKVYHCATFYFRIQIQM